MTRKDPAQNVSGAEAEKAWPILAVSTWPLPCWSIAAGTFGFRVGSGKDPFVKVTYNPLCFPNPYPMTLNS